MFARDETKSYLNDSLVIPRHAQIFHISFARRIDDDVKIKRAPRLFDVG